MHKAAARRRVKPSQGNYILSEDFEGVGAPAGWTNIAGTHDYDYSVSPAPLVGSKSLLINGASFGTPYGVSATLGSSHSKVGIYFVLRPINLGTGGNNTIFDVFDLAGTTDRFELRTTDSDNPPVRLSTTLNSAGSYSGTFVVDTSTTYYVWIDLEVGFSSKFYISTTSIKPESPDITSGPVLANSVGSIRFLLNRNGDAIFDKVRVSSDFIGSNPV